MQVDESVHTYGRTVPLRSTVVYGGVPMDPQIKALRGGIEILVATPGRLLDLVGQKVANLGQVEILVLDEADRMLDMGFLPDIQRIIALLPAEAPEPAVLGDVLRRDPAAVEDDPARPRDGRGRAAQHRRRGGPPARLPGRSRPQGGAPRPPDPQARPAPGARLHPDQDRPRRGSRPGSTAQGLDAVAIHSDRSQPERTRALEEFKTGEIRVLVATDVAARGLDIEDLPHVVNFELPWNPQDYIHRIGRTGRAGPTGDAICSSASTRPTCCAASSACSARRSRGRSRTGFEPRPRRRAAAAPRRPDSRAGGGAAGGKPADPSSASQARPVPGGRLGSLGRRRGSVTGAASADRRRRRRAAVSSAAGSPASFDGAPMSRSGVAVAAAAGVAGTSTSRAMASR